MSKTEIKKTLRTMVGKLRRRADIDEKALATVGSLLAKEGITDEAVVTCEAYGLGSAMSVIVAQLHERGWFLMVTGPKRLPTWSEMAEARWQLIPEDVTMVIPIPCSDRLVSFHENCMLMWQHEPPKPVRKYIITPYSG